MVADRERPDSATIGRMSSRWRPAAASSLMVALRAPDRVNRLVLMGTGGSQAIFSPMPTEGLRRMAMFHGGEGPTLKKLKDVIDLLVFDSSSITEELLAE